MENKELENILISKGFKVRENYNKGTQKDERNGHIYTRPFSETGFFIGDDLGIIKRVYKDGDIVYYGYSDYCAFDDSHDFKPIFNWEYCKREFMKTYNKLDAEIIKLKKELSEKNEKWTILGIILDNLQ